jgi:signal transduction histidine kinase
VLVRIVGENGKIRVSVKDDGVGLDRSRMATCLNGQEGFGLFNIREHITCMGGTVEMYSNPGEGTEVILEADSHV